ncbi:hypothetical protein G7067_08985 [Leucobacter insecticola]|uniref:Uncharacterized protein n=1 Tax=Leucobacter insecticola TaxID=2714934 RepID=A0A6G8FJ76_9MICO|nr:hypothetical protein [Leucobacter insecticola]QIM16516.1 hypothetical protein G7067_08985 [Leucobacter insecticola]
MLVQLWMVAQVAMLLLTVAAGSHLPQSTLPILLVAALGAAILAPVAPWAMRALARAQELTPHEPPALNRTHAVHVTRIPGTPGTPGTALARAPALVVLASA